MEILIKAALEKLQKEFPSRPVSIDINYEVWADGILHKRFSLWLGCFNSENSAYIKFKDIEDLLFYVIQLIKIAQIDRSNFNDIVKGFNNN